MEPPWTNNTTAPVSRPASHQPHPPHLTFLGCWFMVHLCNWHLLSIGPCRSLPVLSQRVHAKERPPATAQRPHPETASIPVLHRTQKTHLTLWGTFLTSCIHLQFLSAVHNLNVSHLGFSVECEPLHSSGSTHHWCWGRRLWHRAGTGRVDRGLDIVYINAFWFLYSQALLQTLVSCLDITHESWQSYFLFLA